MGLFIGASVITLVELLDVIVHGLSKFHWCKKTRKKVGVNHHMNGENVLY